MGNTHEMHETWREIQYHILKALELSGQMKDARFRNAEFVTESLGSAYNWLDKMQGLFEDPEWLQSLLEDPEVKWFA